MADDFILKIDILQRSQRNFACKRRLCLRTVRELKFINSVIRLSAVTFHCFCYERANATGSDDSHAEAEVVRKEASGSVQEVSHAEMQSRFAEVKMVSRFAQAEVVSHHYRLYAILAGFVEEARVLKMVLDAREQQQQQRNVNIFIG